MNEFPGELQQMFKSYGEFHADVDSSPEFMPRLWAKIEARRSPLFAMQRMARLLVFGAMAAALIMGAILTPLMETRHPAGHYADVVARNDTKADQEYAASLLLGEAPQQ
jgi:hypothetical protein